MLRLIYRRSFVRKSVLTLTGVTACYYGYAGAQFGREGLPSEAPSTISFNAYRLLPLNVLSRFWGWCSSVNIQTSLRRPLLGLYARTFNCNLQEAEESDLQNYSCLSDFFRRPLKAGAREIDGSSLLVSPCDGTILYFGKVTDDQMEQIKGVSYSLEGFLGPHMKCDSKDTEQVRSQQWIHGSNTCLYHCIIYLAPGDYHRFHSPADWEIAYRRYFPGYLLSVNPKIASWIQGLFSINERVVYYGKWKHGFFAFSAVGATNVGNITVFEDKKLQTNSRRLKLRHGYEEIQFRDKTITQTKGMLFGEFNLGSSIVLIFEAPNDFEFDFSPGSKVPMGRSLQKC